MGRQSELALGALLAGLIVVGRSTRERSNLLSEDGLANLRARVSVTPLGYGSKALGALPHAHADRGELSGARTQRTRRPRPEIVGRVDHRRRNATVPIDTSHRPLHRRHFMRLLEHVPTLSPRASSRSVRWTLLVRPWADEAERSKIAEPCQAGLREFGQLPFSPSG